MFDVLQRLRGAGLASLFASIFTVLTLVGCGGGGGGAAPVTPGGGLGALQSIAVTPDNSDLRVGATQTFVATGSYTDGTTQNLSSQVVWASSAPLVASIGAATGVASGLTEGAATITATFGGRTGNTQLNVTNKTLQSIAVTPANSSLGVGATQGFVAVGTYSDASTQNISSTVAWASSAPSVVSITAAGEASAATTGTSNISAALSGVTGSTPLTVTAKTLQSIAVTPAAFSIAVGATQQLVATGTYSDGSTQVITNSVAWTTANGAVATVGATSGLVTGATAGNGVAITAKLGVVSGESRGAVTAAGVTLTGLSVSISTLFIGPTFKPFPQVCAQFSNSTGSCPYSPVTWTSSNPAVAIVSDTQGVKALTAGVTTLTARSGSISASNTLTVNAPVLTAIAVLPAAPTIGAGTQLQLTAMGSYSDGSTQNITALAGLSWASSAPAAVSVNAAGVASGLAAGSATLTASAAGRAGSTTATVPTTAPPPPTTVVLYPVNDNTIVRGTLNATYANSVYPYNYWFASPGIGMGCSWFPTLTATPGVSEQQFTCSEGLLKFDLTSLAGKTIQSATLSLQSTSFGVGTNPRQWFLTALSSGWNGASVTWNNAAPPQYYTGSGTLHNPPTAVGQVYNLDQTTTVRNWVTGFYVNNGYRMGLWDNFAPPNPVVSADVFEFHSSEDPTLARRPRLTVTYQ